MKREDLALILQNHKKWLDGIGGERASLRRADLCEANLRGASLRGANLFGANLYGANLRGASLRGADLFGADLRGASLRGANLFGANLYGANLRGASLRGADLCEANLRGASLRGADLCEANLCGADLFGANLYGANLRGTILDPDKDPNQNADGFSEESGWIIGYRTRKAGHIDKYRDGRFYSADWFSVCEETECHPGLYLWPTMQHARCFSGQVEFIRVRTKKTEIHKAGNKWRCRWFEVIGTVTEEKQ